MEITKTCQNEKITYSSEYSYKHNNYGTPQGGIVSPLLFLVYINDIPEAIGKDCILFADDTTIMIKSDNNKNLEKEIVQALDNAIVWLEKNNLKINMTKTNIIQFQTYNANINKLDIHYKDSHLTTVDNCVFLGITVDKNCNWKTHIDKILVKIDRFIYVLKRIRQTVNCDTAMLAYHGYVSSVLRYGIVLWGNSVDSDRVFKAQKKCIRAICGAHFLDSCKPLFHKLKILPLPCLYIFEICTFVKRNYNLFETTTDRPNSRTRHKDRLRLPPIKLKLFKKNVYCMSIIIYNHLPNSFQDLPLTMFKKILFNLLLFKRYYTVKDYLEDKSIESVICKLD